MAHVRLARVWTPHALVENVLCGLLSNHALAIQTGAVAIDIRSSSFHVAIDHNGDTINGTLQRDIQIRHSWASRGRKNLRLRALQEFFPELKDRGIECFELLVLCL